MILDQLLEKKDVIIYIDTRIRTLIDAKSKVTKMPNVERREIAARQIQGRILELRELKKNLQNIKDKCKEQWESCAKQSLF